MRGTSALSLDAGRWILDVGWSRARQPVLAACIGVNQHPKSNIHLRYQIAFVPSWMMRFPRAPLMALLAEPWELFDRGRNLPRRIHAQLALFNFVNCR